MSTRRRHGPRRSLGAHLAEQALDEAREHLAWGRSRNITALDMARAIGRPELARIYRAHAKRQEIILAAMAAELMTARRITPQMGAGTAV